MRNKHIYIIAADGPMAFENNVVNYDVAEILTDDEYGCDVLEWGLLPKAVFNEPWEILDAIKSRIENQMHDDIYEQTSEEAIKYDERSDNS